MNECFVVNLDSLNEGEPQITCALLFYIDLHVCHRKRYEKKVNQMEQQLIVVPLYIYQTKLKSLEDSAGGCVNATTRP